MRKIVKSKKALIAISILAIVAGNLAFLSKSYAGTFTNTQLIEMGGASNVNPMIAGDGQSLAIAFMPATTVSAGSWNFTLTFPGWTGGSNGSVNSSQTISNTGCTSLFAGTPTALPGSLSASGASNVLTISSTGGSNALNSGTLYCTELISTTAVTNPTAANDYNVTFADTPDTQTIGIDVLSSGGNSYSVSATVAPTFTMSLGATTDAFTSNLLSTAVNVTTGVTTTVKTNAASGWFVWAADANNGKLTSSSISHSIGPGSVTPASNFAFASNTGTEQYGLGVSGSLAANGYQYTSSNHGAGLSTTYNEIATDGSPASNDQFTTHELADISPTTPPASDYGDIITEIGSGSF